MATRVDYEKLEMVAGQLTSAEEEMLEKLTYLVGVVDGLVADGFVTDTASSSFDEAYNQFTTSTRTGLEALPSMANYLKLVATKYRETDESLNVSYG
jgi:uncharacterized protein YukE